MIKKKPIVYIETKDLTRQAFGMWISRFYVTIFPMLCTYFAVTYKSPMFMLVGLFPFLIPLNYDSKNKRLTL